MVTLKVTGTVGQGLGALATGVDHLEVVETASGPALVALSAVGGGLVTLHFGGNGRAQVADTQSLSGSFWAQSTGNLSLIDTGDGVFAGVAAEGSNRLLGYQIDGTAIGAASALQGNGLSAAEGTMYQVTQSGYLFAAGADGTLRCFRPMDPVSFNAGQVTRDDAETFHATPAVVDTVSMGARDFLITACLDDTGISVFEVDQNTGHVSHTGSVSAQNGLGLFDTVVDMETAVVGGHGFVLVVTRSETGEGAALSVIAIDQNGLPQATDHILDNQLSRFGAATELEVVTHGDWTYVVASGGDDGVSLFTLSPTGRLLHLDTITSTSGAMLDSVSGMAATVAQDGDLQIMLAQHTAVGFTQLEVDLSAQGDVRMGSGGTLSGTARNDLLLGSARNDTIEGGAGNDILEDGAGQDVLRGGSGADTFVLLADGQRDEIDGFEAGRDRIDLSAVPFLYSTDQITFNGRAWGAEITYRGETLALRSADGNALQAWQVFAAIDWTVDRPLLLTPIDPQSVQNNEATNGADTLSGGAGVDRLLGLGGNDKINAAAGADWIEGGWGFDTISAGEGSDTVWGGDGRDLVYLNQGDDLYNDNTQGGELGRDTVFAGFGDDTIEGGNGDDEFRGEDGADLINGRLGNDLIYGGNQYDTITAGQGQDTVFGGNGRDLVFLNQGNDLFTDNDQAGVDGRDTVFGGLGNDTIQGGGGDDTFYGEDGNDVITGGRGRDAIWLGNGNDRFVDTDQADASGRDTITGGAGADTFVFGTQIAQDVITDFDVTVDRLELAAGLVGGQSARDVVADAILTDAGFMLTFDAGQSVLLVDVMTVSGLEDAILIY